jgi:glucose-6-phosphate isomerase
MSLQYIKDTKETDVIASDESGKEGLINYIQRQIDRPFEAYLKFTYTSFAKGGGDEGKVDNVIIYLDQQNEYHFGYLYTWLCFTAMYSAYLHNLNPFDQPGVEIYKNRITNILKKGK